MTKQGWLFLLISSFLTVAANLMIRGGIVRAGGFASKLSEFPQAILRLLSQPIFVIGAVFYGTAALIWFKVIETEQLSIAYPLMVSLTFIFVTVGAIVFYKEPFAWLKVLGCVVILLGILIFSQVK